jgi:putative ABC transport system substrate-binding protein
MAAVALAFAAAQAAPQAQTVPLPTKPAKLWQFGVVGPMQPVEPVMARLRDLGYLPGTHYQVVHFAPGPDLSLRLTAHLAKPDGHLDVVIAIASPAAQLVKQTAPAVPVVAWTHDAVKSGLIKSYAQPSGMITGVDSRAPEYVLKRVELLKTLLPQARRLGVLHGASDFSARFHLDALREVAAAQGLTIVPLPLRSAGDVATSLQSAQTSGVDAVMVVTDSITGAAIQDILKQLGERRLPGLCEFKLFAAMGCTASYGSTFDEFGAIAARQVDRILRGTKVGDIPMEFPTRYELVLNVKQMNALGIKASQELRLRADEVIE